MSRDFKFVIYFVAAQINYNKKLTIVAMLKVVIIRYFASICYFN